jgi:hypothetical protein
VGLGGDGLGGLRVGERDVAYGGDEGSGGELEEFAALHIDARIAGG